MTVVLLFAVAAGLLRFYLLGAQSLWLDEALSYFDAHQALGEIHRSVLASPPLFHYFVHGMDVLFGRNDFWLRFPSAFFGALTVPVVYFTVRQSFDEKTARWSAIFLLLSPFHFVYSQELRMYTLLALLGWLSVYLFQRGRRSDAPLDWVGWGSVTCLGLYTHNWFLFLWAAQFLTLVYFSVRQAVVPRRALMMNIVLFVFYLPWIPILLDQMRKPIFSAMDPVSLVDLLKTLVIFCGVKSPSGHSWIGVQGVLPIGVMAISGLWLFGKGLWRMRLQTGEIANWAVAGLFLPLILALGVGMSISPVYMANRYPIMVLCPFLVIAAYGIGSHKTVWRYIHAGIACVWLIGCSIIIMSYFQNFQKAPWKPITQHILSSGIAPEKQLISFEKLDYNQIALRYYVENRISVQMDHLESFPSGHTLFVPVRADKAASFYSIIPTHLKILSDTDFRDYRLIALVRK